jgi:hypothetical protein
MGKDEASNDAKVPLPRHTLRQLEATGGGLGDLGEDGIERSHQERLKDNKNDWS